MLLTIGTAFKSFMDIFGAQLLVPLVVFLLSLILKVKPMQAFRAAIYMAIGLVAFNIILGILMGQMESVMTLMSANAGKVFDVVDVGWPAAATIVYNNSMGMIYLVIGLLWNVVLFLLKVTDTFEPTDIWNYYFFVTYAICVQFVTGSFVIGLLCALFCNLFVLLVSDAIGPALQEYYGYDGLTCTCISCTNIAVFAGLINILFNKIGFGRVKVDPDTLNKKLGFFGEPAMLGTIIGLIMGAVAYMHSLGSASTWSTILTFAFTLAVMLVIYPTVSGLFVRGLIPISNTMNARMRSGEIKRKYFLIGIDPAVYFGETANITAGLVLTPILILTAIILPGNRLVPLADIPAIPFMVIGLTAVFQGDILKSVICGSVYGSLAHLIASDMAELFTNAATLAGFTLSEGQTFVGSWLVSAQPPLWLFYKCFSAGGGLKYILMAALVVLYVVALIHFKKHRRGWYKYFGASDEYIDQYMGQAEAIEA
ncbi:PTS transporter subunit IIC [Mediterraneibacter massiliensis]|uniref:PTS transporter subunit IIC n=1 Tax=Mediterraneibacter massiliensis TaxID=1720300 RepID=UPI0022DF4A98|nr:PTS transporter subunit IIC [Mediterraneibacter massiliensis]